MKKLNLLISLLFVIQLTSFSQEFTNTISDNIEDFHEYNTEIIYLGDTLIVADSSIYFVYDNEIKRPYRKTWFKERDTKGRQLVNINYGWDIENQRYYQNTRDSLSYYEDNSIKERYGKLYDRINSTWHEVYYVMYNANGLELNVEHLQWDALIEQYYYGTQLITTYNLYDDIIKEESNLYDTATNDWAKSSMIEYLRNDSSFIIREQTNKFSIYNNDWYPISKIEYLRDENNLLLEQQTSNYDTLVSSWDNINLTEHLRDETGNDTLIVSSTWNTEENLWKQQSKNNRVFDEGHRVLLDVGTMWSDELESWHFTFKTEFVYTEQGDQDTATYYKWYLDYGFWYGTGRQIRDYDEDRVLINVENQDYDLVYEYWFNVSRVMWEYENDRIINFIIDDWINDAWFGRTHTYYSFNEEGYRDTVISKHFSLAGAEWDFYTRNTIAFNDNGTVNHYHAERRYNNEDWFTDNKTFYYYSEFILPSAISEYNQIEFKVYPNPTRGEIIIELPEESVGSNIVFISDMQGRIIEVVPINNITQTIDLSKEQSGIYFIRVSNGNKTGTKRIILN